jgi:hypothetical protein
MGGGTLQLVAFHRKQPGMSKFYKQIGRIYRGYKGQKTEKYRITYKNKGTQKEGGLASVANRTTTTWQGE